HDSVTHPLLYLPYSFLGGFSLTAILLLWVVIILFAIIELCFFGWKITQRLVRLTKGKQLLFV
ncbi:MAG: hypothetical protein KAT16_01440, partial [Candidatus Heimdallarchaeota archaeon]|nr:hypothetical protein [Candidatus Heimdallarchaeota archaeon]